MMTTISPIFKIPLLPLTHPSILLGLGHLAHQYDPMVHLRLHTVLPVVLLRVRTRATDSTKALGLYPPIEVSLGPVRVRPLVSNRPLSARRVSAKVEVIGTISFPTLLPQALVILRIPLVQRVAWDIDTQTRMICYVGRYRLPRRHHYRRYLYLRRKVWVWFRFLLQDTDIE